MFWYNVISHNPSYYFKMYTSEITNFLVNCIIMNFHQNHIVFCVQVFSSLGSFIPRYFILSVHMINGIVSLISFSAILFLVYRNARYCCVLILYPANLLNTLTSSSSFLVASLRFSIYRVMSFANSDSFPSFPICIPFIAFSSLIVVARTSKSLLNNNGESEHPCLVPDLGGNIFSFTPLRIMFAVGLLYMAFSMLR